MKKVLLSFLMFLIAIPYGLIARGGGGHGGGGHGGGHGGGRGGGHRAAASRAGGSRSAARSSRSSRSSSRSRSAARRGGRGGRGGRGRGGRGRGGWGGGWGYGGWFWGLGWGLGFVGLAIWADALLDAGYDQQVVVLAQNDDWDGVQDAIMQRLDDLESQLAQSAADQEDLRKDLQTQIDINNKLLDEARARRSSAKPAA